MASVNFLELKPLTADFLPGALELDHLCFGGLWTLEGYQRELVSPNSDLLILVAEENKSDRAHPLPAVVGLGCLWAILEEAHITILAIHPAYQRQGLGQALLYSLIVAAWQRRLEWMTLEVRAANQSAIALYQKFGFQEVGRRRKYYPETGEDALIFWHNGLRHSDFDKTLHKWGEEISDRLSRAGWYLAKDCSSQEYSTHPLDLGPHY